MKWIIGVLAIALIGWFAYRQRTEIKTSYVNGLAEYTQLPGKEYVVERDMYVFKLKHHSSDWPFVGANVPDASVSVATLPNDVTTKNVGTETSDVRILDIIRTGSRFKIASVRRDQGRSSTSISFEILLTDEDIRHYPRLDAFWIMDHTRDNEGAPPSILETYAVLRIKK